MQTLAEALAQAWGLLTSGQGYVTDVLLLSIRVSGVAVLIGVVIGMPVGIAVGMFRFPARKLLIAVIHTGFALPPVVVGLFVYLLLSRSGPLGRLDMLFTPPAMIFAQTVLAAPYVAGITLSAVQAVPREVRLQARALGATRLRAMYMHVREARVGLLAAVIAGFGAALSEVGAVMMVGGNILGETRVMTTAIVLETRRGNFGMAMAFGIVLLSLAFIVNLLLTRAQQAGTETRRTW